MATMPADDKEHRPRVLCRRSVDRRLGDGMKTWKGKGERMNIVNRLVIVAARVVIGLTGLLVLTACAEVLEPVQGLGDALRGLFEGMF